MVGATSVRAGSRGSSLPHDATRVQKGTMIQHANPHGASNTCTQRKEEETEGVGDHDKENNTTEDAQSFNIRQVQLKLFQRHPSVQRHVCRQLPKSLLVYEHLLKLVG